MADRVMPRPPKRVGPRETIGSGLIVLALTAGALAQRDVVEPWHYGAGSIGVLMVLVGAWQWARGRRRG